MSPDISKTSAFWIDIDFVIVFPQHEIGRASGREREYFLVDLWVGDVCVKYIS